MKKGFTLISKACQRGFTLIELLVVVTIMMVLMGIGVVYYSSVQKKARDSKRKSDLEQVRAALEMYRSDNGAYFYSLADDLNFWGEMINALVAGGYLANSETLVDPKGYDYVYYSNGTGSYYQICALMEGEDPGQCNDFDCGPADCNYQVENP